MVAWRRLTCVSPEMRRLQIEQRPIQKKSSCSTRAQRSLPSPGAPASGMAIEIDPFRVPLIVAGKDTGRIGSMHAMVFRDPLSTDDVPDEDGSGPSLFTVLGWCLCVAVGLYV